MKSLAFLLIAMLPLAVRAATTCEAVQVLASDTRQPLRGVEDIVIDRDAGLAYLSATDRWTVEREVGGPLGRTTQGGLYALPLAASERPLVARPLTRDFAAGTDFHPHGIDLYVAPNRTRTLFAVNHRFLHERGAWRTENAVEIFDVAQSSLVHRVSVVHPFLSSPNDLVAVGPDAFFVTNDHGGGNAFERAVEDVTGHGLGSVAKVDLSRPPAERVQIVATGIAYANGIEISRDRRALYVAASRDKAVLAIELSRSQPKPRTIPLPLGPDNLSWGSDGKLYVAGHPDLLRFALYATTANLRWGLHSAPSQVLRLNPAAPDPKATINSLWYDDGATLSASTVAAVAGDLMFVGTVYADRIGVCRLQEEPARHAMER